MNGLQFARVVATHPQSNSVDVVLMEDGRRLSGVQVMAKSAGGDFGSYGLGIPTQTGYEASTTRKRDVFALVGWAGRNPVVLGFMFPQVNQMLFEDVDQRNAERSIDRHPSDLYSFIDGEGNLEVRHPSGAFIRIAEDPDSEDLNEKDFMTKWKTENNVDRKVHIHVQQADGKAWVDIDTDGNITVFGPVLHVDAPKAIFTGNVTIEGSLNVAGAIGSQADVLAGDGEISLLNHKHTGVDPGAGQSAGPITGGAMPPADDFTPDPEHLPATNS